MRTDTINPGKLAQAERESLSRIHELRERLLSQLGQLELETLHCCREARGGHIREARQHLSEAMDLAYAISESSKALDPLFTLLEDSRG